MAIDKKQKRQINTLIQILTLVLVAAFIYSKLDSENLKLSWQLFQSSLYQDPAIWIIVVMLMPVNWLLEGVKWKLLAKPLIKLSTLDALKGVLSGLTVSFVTPHGWGDYLGRIGIIESIKRERLIGALLFGRITQLFITVSFGIFGLLMYFERWPFLYIWYFAVILIIALSLFFYKAILRKIRKLLKKWYKYVSIIKSYDARQILEVIFFAFLRYLTFTLQFLLIMILLEVDLSVWILFSGITWIFLIKSILPSFNFLSDLGIREVSTVLFFEFYLDSISPVLSATLIIWMINILLPSVAGIIFVFSIKIFR